MGITLNFATGEIGWSSGTSGTVDTTPGGAASVWELEAVLSAWLMEDGSSFWLTEA